MGTYETDTVCPHCHTHHDRASSIKDEGEPGPGDMSMCIQCGRWATFDQHQGLRKPTAEEMARLGRDFDLPKLHLAWVMAIARGDTKGGMKGPMRGGAR